MHKIIPFLPGYMWVNDTLKSTGVALPPTQHVCSKTGRVVYYCRPVFEFGATIGMFVPRDGVKKWVMTSDLL